MNRLVTAILLVAVFLLQASAALAFTYYVPDNYATIQAALDAVVNGDVIIVRDNTYTGWYNKNLNFGGKEITLRSENGPANCIIDCESDGRGFYFHSGEIFASVLDGFTIINGNAAGGSGAGIYCSYLSSPNIYNCVIRSNTASFGGGIYCGSDASPTILNCTIVGNSATRGGGIHCVDASANIDYCTLSGNRAYEGGAIYCNWDAAPSIGNSILWGNTATSVGPEIAVFSSLHPSSLSVWDSNVKGGEAAAYVEPGCTLDYSGNNNMTPPSRPLFVNAPLFYDWTSYVETTTTVSVGDESIYTIGDVIDIDNDGVARTVTAIATELLTFSPAISAPSVGNEFIKNFGKGGSLPENYHLTFTSACINVGTPFDVPSYDIDGDTRPWGPDYDIGSDEYLNLQHYSRIPDINGNMHSELAVLSQNPSTNAVVAQVKDSFTGLLIRAVWFSDAYTPVDLDVVPDINDNDSSELALLSTNLSNGKVLMQVKDSFTGLLIRNVWFSDVFTPIDLTVIPDLNSNDSSELAVLSMNESNEKVVVEIKDPATGLLVKNVWFSDAYNYAPLELAVLNDLNSNNSPELAVLSIKESTGKVVVQIKDSWTGLLIRNVYFSDMYLPLGMKVMPDINSNSHQELAVLSVNWDTGKVVSQVKDPFTGLLVKNVWHSTVYLPLALEIVPDINSNDYPELCVLNLNLGTKKVVTESKDSSTGLLVKNVWYSKQYEPQAFVVIPDTNSNGYSELAVLSINWADGRIVIQVKDTFTGLLVRNVWL